MTALGRVRAISLNRTYDGLVPTAGAFQIRADYRFGVFAV